MVAAELVSPFVVQSAAVQTVSDDDLMLQVAARGDTAQDALATLYDRYSAAVHSLGVRMLGDGPLAEHVVQETFWRVWRGAAQYEPGRGRLGTWLLRIARNAGIEELRAASRRPPAAWRLFRSAGSAAPAGGADAPPSRELAHGSPDVPDLVWIEEQRRAVRVGLATLPEEQRHALTLAYFGGCTQREIAEAQGVPVSTVKTRLALGLRKLHRYLGTCGITADGEALQPLLAA